MHETVWDTLLLKERWLDIPLGIANLPYCTNYVPTMMLDLIRSSDEINLIKTCYIAIQFVALYLMGVLLLSYDDFMKKQMQMLCILSCSRADTYSLHLSCQCVYLILDFCYLDMWHKNAASFCYLVYFKCQNIPKYFHAKSPFYK